MDNDVGGNYFRGDLRGGRSAELQRESFRLLVAEVRELGAEVEMVRSP